MARREIVLIVEDDPLLRMLSSEMIQEDGYDVVEAGHAEEAILILETRPDIDIMFTDINMPGSMDGLKLAHYVRDRWPPIRIITTTGRSDLALDVLPSNSQFLPKPYQASDITAALHRLA